MKDYLKINAARDNKYLKNLAQHISLMEQQGLYPREFQMPVTLQFELVAECNLRCKHCYNRSGEGHSETRLKIDDWLALAQDLRRHGGIFQCILSGGEPLLLGNDLFTLMDALDADGTSFVIISNGYLLTAEKAARLAKYRYYWFQISIDGDTPELHDEFRQVAGSFAKAIAGAMHIAHRGLPLVIAHTVTPKTLPRLEYMADLAFRLGAASLMVGQVLPSGRANRYAAEISLSAEQENELYGRLENLQQTYGSNMDIEQMRHRCPEAQLLGTGRLDGWRLMFKGSKTGAYATIEREKGMTVPILLWRISVADEARLDRYEGFPSFYYKRTIQAVKTDTNGKDIGITRGMVYIMHEERKLGVPSEHYYMVLAEAYVKFGFDLKILEDAYEYSDREPMSVPAEELPYLW